MPPATTTPQVSPDVLPGDARPARGGLVRRDRLLARLGATGGSPLIMLVAPAGYGKSTILADWAEEDERPSAWLTLDERHNDPALFLSAIAALLHRIEPMPEEVFAPLATPRSGVSSVAAPRIGEAIRSRERPFILVLDDLHLVDNPDCAAALVAILQAVQPGSQIAMASRAEPALPLGRMRADRLVVELGAKDLEMDAGEAAQTLEACGLELQPDSVRRLLERTEGWPVGLYLAGLSLSKNPKMKATLADFHGDDRLFADYLQDEFLDGLDPATLDFLVETSILDRLSGETCDAVLERSGSAEMLHRLVRSNLLIVPLDRRDRVYRHHALLRDMLLSELDRRGAMIASTLHVRASEFFRERGDVDRAVSHAIQSGDRELSDELIWVHSASYVSSGRHATVRGWLANFAEEQIAASPALSLAQATEFLAEGNGGAAERWIDGALDGLRGSKKPADAPKAAAARIIKASGFAREGAIQMREDVLAGIDVLASDDPFRALCHLIDGTALYLTSRRDEAQRPLEDGVRAGASRAPTIETLCRAQLSLLALDEGEVTEAERQSQLAISKIHHCGLGDHPTQALAFAASALVAGRRGRSDAATAHAKTTVRLLEGLQEMAPWYEAETRITLGRALILLDDVVAARSHLAAAGRYSRMVSDAVVLMDWLDVAWAEAHTARSIGGSWPLTPAELRLLHMLPTHFSFREIADQVFVSQNTVKTQAQSIYRKLGVSSRGEAVACAQASGLLDAELADSPQAGDAPTAQRA